jgi:hypothetical protein
LTRERLLGGLFRLPAWSGNLRLFTVYWLATTVIFLVSRRSERAVLASGMAVALFDAPIVFFLQWATFPTSNPSGVAGFTVGLRSARHARRVLPAALVRDLHRGGGDRLRDPAAAASRE